MKSNLHAFLRFNGNDREVNRTTTIEIKDVGNTKVEVAAEAKAKIEAAKADTPK